MQLPDSRAGAMSCLTGIAARKSIDEGRPIKIADLDAGSRHAVGCGYADRELDGTRITRIFVTSYQRIRVSASREKLRVMAGRPGIRKRAYRAAAPDAGSRGAAPARPTAGAAHAVGALSTTSPATCCPAAIGAVGLERAIREAARLALFGERLQVDAVELLDQVLELVGEELGQVRRAPDLDVRGECSPLGPDETTCARAPSHRRAWTRR